MESIVDDRAMGKRIKELRMERKLTQEKLAEEIGVSAQLIGFIERGERRPSMESASRIAILLGTTLDYIILGKNNRCNQQSCPLYFDLKGLVDSYGEGQALLPRVHNN